MKKLFLTLAITILSLTAFGQTKLIDASKFWMIESTKINGLELLDATISGSVDEQGKHTIIVHFDEITKEPIFLDELDYSTVEYTTRVNEGITKTDLTYMAFKQRDTDKSVVTMIIMHSGKVQKIFTTLYDVKFTFENIKILQ